jgi:GT2 family glycosyltransferase
MGIFIRKEAFAQLGGYANIPLMEDMDICRRMKRLGKIIIMARRIMTSSRRWKSQGILVTVVTNWRLQLAWLVGVPPHILYT